MAFNIDFNQFKPSSKGGPKVGLKAPVQQPQTLSPSTQSLSSSFKPQPISQPPSIELGPNGSPNKSFFGKVFDALSIPSQFTERILTGGRGYEKSLESAGIRQQPGKLDFNDVASFTGRMILDPLNLVPVGKAAGLIGKVGSKIDDVTRFSKVVNKVNDLPLVKRAVDEIGERFIKGYKLPKSYVRLKDEITPEMIRGQKEVVERVNSMFTGLSDDAKRAASYFLEPKEAGAGVDLGSLRRNLEQTGEWDSLRSSLKDARKMLDNEVIDLVQRGRLDGETAKDLLTRGGYFPHTDFAPQSLKKYFGGAKFGEKRWYLSKRSGGAGYTFNAPKALAKREYQQVVDNIAQDFLKTVKKQFGVKIGKGKSVPEGFVPILTDKGGRLSELRGWALPERIFNDIDRTFKPAGQIAKIIDSFNRAWKPTATAINPSFHLMNIYGNLYNSWLGGMKDPRRFLQAIKGGFGPDEAAIIKKAGVLERGQFGADLISQTFDNPDGVRSLKLFDRFRQVGSFFEDNARSAFFLNSRQKFLSQGLNDATATRKAIDEMNKYLFDYLTGLTPFESNIMRRVFPFYTWARFNIPLQLQTLITQPEKVALVSKIYRELNKDGIPEGEYEGISFPTWFKDSSGNPIRFRPNLPAQDIFNLGPTRVGQMINPLFKEGYEIGKYVLTGRNVAPYDLFTGAPRTDVDLPVSEQLRDIGSGVAKSLFRPVRSFEKTRKEGFSPSSILRQAVGGLYPVDEQSAKLRSISRQGARNAAIERRIERIQRDPTLTESQKQKRIDGLLKFLE